MPAPDSPDLTDAGAGQINANYSGTVPPGQSILDVYYSTDGSNPDNPAGTIALIDLPWVQSFSIGDFIQFAFAWSNGVADVSPIGLASQIIPA